MRADHHRSPPQPLPGGPEASADATTLAAIDVGTNSIHLVVAAISAVGDFNLIGGDKDMVQLGKGGFENHLLTSRAMDDGIAALQRFKRIAELKGAAKIKAVATSAVREAHNGGDFVERVQAEVGLDLRVISATEEAYLIYLGVRHAVDLGADANLIIDIGGGSVEFVVCTAASASAMYSYKLGGSRLAELFLQRDPATEEDYRALRQYIRTRLAPFLATVPPGRIKRCIGTSGTIRDLAAMCALRRGSAADDDPGRSVLRLDELKALRTQLRGLPRDQRRQLPGMDDRRVDTALPAAILLRAVLKATGVAELQHCAFALREGVILNYIGRRRHKLAARATWPDPRTRSVMQLGSRCGCDANHAEQVTRLALLLFDQLAPLHGLAAGYRELLGYAAQLHDAGHLISHQGHHKHSYYLIRNGQLNGFSDDEIEIIANLARYHRRDRPKKSHFGFSNLADAHRMSVKKLSVLLRLAEALDRTHGGVVRTLDVAVGDDGVVITVVTDRDAELELWAARREVDQFVREFGKPLVLQTSGSGDADDWSPETCQHTDHNA